MPHMANLSWMILFITFNVTIMNLFFSMKFPMIKLKLDSTNLKIMPSTWQC